MKIACKGQYDIEVGAVYHQCLTIRQENPVDRTSPDLIVVDSEEQAKALVEAIRGFSATFGWKVA